MSTFQAPDDALSQLFEVRAITPAIIIRQTLHTRLVKTAQKVFIPRNNQDRTGIVQLVNICTTHAGIGYEQDHISAGFPCQIFGGTQQGLRVIFV